MSNVVTTASRPVLTKLRTRYLLMDTIFRCAILDLYDGRLTKLPVPLSVLMSQTKVIYRLEDKHVFRDARPDKSESLEDLAARTELIVYMDERNPGLLACPGFRLQIG